ncbi:MAG: LysR family transcriptional regulator [Burkholderiales bacterium]
MSLTLKSMQYFNAVAETGSISVAMQNLNVSQAAITESVQRLEAHLGVLLFRRHARGMALTHAGHEFWRHTQRILASISAAEEALASRPDSVSGELVIGSISPLTGYYLPGLLERYRRAFPKVATHIMEDAGHYIEHQIINGELDVALTATSALENAGAFHTSTLVRSPWRLWVSARHAFADRANVSIADIKNESVIDLHNDELERGSGNLWRNIGIRPRSITRTRSIEAVRSLVATGYGVCVLPQVLFRAWSLEGTQLVCIPLIEEIAPLEIGVVWRRGAPVSTIAQGFISTASEYGQALQPTFKAPFPNQNEFVPPLSA